MSRVLKIITNTFLLSLEKAKMSQTAYWMIWIGSCMKFTTKQTFLTLGKPCTQSSETSWLVVQTEVWTTSQNLEADVSTFPLSLSSCIEAEESKLFHYDLEKCTPPGPNISFHWSYGVWLETSWWQIPDGLVCWSPNSKRRMAKHSTAEGCFR